MKILALDIGTRRTGVAFVDTANGIPLPLDTILSESTEELVSHIHQIADERGVEKIVIGLPLLLSGDEGSQSGYVRECAAMIEQSGLQIHFVDERYTTGASAEYDGDARVACGLLTTFLERMK